MIIKLKQRIINEIYTIASDRRKRVLLEDQNKWLKEKLRHIKKLALQLDGEKVKINKNGEIID